MGPRQLRSTVEVREALESLCHSFIQANQWLVAHVLFGPLTAVIVERSSKRHPHGGEGGMDGDKGAQQRNHQ